MESIFETVLTLAILVIVFYGAYQLGSIKGFGKFFD